MSSSPVSSTIPSEVVVGIETDRGLWVQALVAAGYQVYAINPLAVARYRDRHNVAGAKSDPGDAKVLADLVRTDRHNHRPIAGDSARRGGDQGAGPWSSEPDLGPATGRPTSCATRCASTTRPRWTRSMTWPIATRSPCSAERPTPDGGRRAVARPDRARRSSVAAGNATSTGEPARSRRRCAAEQLAAPAALADAFAATTTAAVGIIAELNRQIAELETDARRPF